MSHSPNVQPVHASKPATSQFSEGGHSKVCVYPMPTIWSGEVFLQAIERRLGRPLHANARRLASWPWAETAAGDSD